MKQEWERQLKKQWDAATLKDTGFEIDAENLWQKINKPSRGRKVSLHWLKYAVAVFSGAVITLFITRLNKPEEIVLQPMIQMKKNINPPVKDSQAFRKVSNLINPTVTQPAVAIKSKAIMSKNAHPGLTSLVKRPEIATAVNSNTQPVSSQAPGPVTVPASPPETKTISRNAPKPARKTVHLFDLENPSKDPVKTSKLMMAIEVHTNPKSNDIAFSTKLLTKQF